jgi:hypothetical protein
MSVIYTHAPHGTTDGPRFTHPAVPGEPVSVEQYIADVLGRAHQAAEALHEPDEARAILHVAQLFAEDLARTDLRFDRVQFIEAITRDPT